MLYSWYDLQTSPCNFDFFTFAVIAKSEADRLSKEPHIIFAPGFKDGFQHPNKKAYNIEELKFRLNHVLFPACYSLGIGFTYCKTRKHAEQVYYSTEDEFFPYEYEIEKPPKGLSRSCALSNILDQHKKHKLFWPQPTEYALNVIKKEFPDNPIVITLREASYGSDRNSDLQEWKKFINHVYKAEDVVVVRDTSKWNSDIRGKYGFIAPSFPLASIDLDTRLALYKHAKMNFSVGGGPTVLLHYSEDIPYRTFKFSSNKHGSSSEKYLTSMGFPVGSQWPWKTNNQKILWENDTFENLKREYNNWRDTYEQGS